MYKRLLQGESNGDKTVKTTLCVLGVPCGLSAETRSNGAKHYPISVRLWCGTGLYNIGI